MIQLLIEAVSKERFNDVQRGEDVEQFSFLVHSNKVYEFNKITKSCHAQQSF